ncbi:hypothetical protein ACQGS6_22065 [Bacillus sp. GMs2/2]|uniref:hypothetical protein n=1 Tax=Bacillus sp. GMs2/2 TaxID=3418494 RepID=UPI003CF9C255
MYIQQQIQHRVNRERSIRKDAVILCEFVVTLDKEVEQGKEKSMIDWYHMFYFV